MSFISRYREEIMVESGFFLVASLFNKRLGPKVTKLVVTIDTTAHPLLLKLPRH